MDSNIRFLFYNEKNMITKDPNPALNAKAKKELEPNSKPSFMQRLAGGIIDLCFIFLAYWGMYYICMSIPISNTYYFYVERIVRLENDYMYVSGYGEKVTITSENADEYTGYLQYPYEDGSNTFYVIAVKENATSEEKVSYENILSTSTKYSNLNFDRQLINYGLNVLSGTVSLSFFLLLIPLCNKRRATIGEHFSEQQLISTRFQGRARWYHVLLRFLFILIVDGCLPFLFLELTTFLIMPILFLILASATKKGRTLHCLCSGTQVIDRRSFTPMVTDDE